MKLGFESVPFVDKDLAKQIFSLEGFEFVSDELFDFVYNHLFCLSDRNASQISLLTKKKNAVLQNHTFTQGRPWTFKVTDCPNDALVANDKLVYSMSANYVKLNMEFVTNPIYNQHNIKNHFLYLLNTNKRKRKRK